MKTMRAMPAGPIVTLALLLVAAALVQGISYWPGIMTADAINQYGQAVEGAYDDWHPPIMAWLWHQLIGIHTGPAPMFVIQLALYWTGYALIVHDAYRRDQRVTAVLVTLCALMPFPLAIMGAVLKDCLMQGLLLCAVALSLRSGAPGEARGGTRGETWGGGLARSIAVLLLLLAGLLRFNAFLATLPLLLPLLPTALLRTPVRIAATALVALAVTLVAMPLTNRLIGAEPSGVTLSLVIFDLGGITRHTGVSMLPDVGVANPVAVNAHCYRPDKWDSYSPWGHPPCPIGFDRIRQTLDDTGTSAFPLWARAVLAHPIAYARHRADHFNLNARFLVHDEVVGAAPDRAVENEWGFTVPMNAGLRFIDRLAAASVHSPLGWPIWWMVLAAGLIAVSPGLPSRDRIVPIALSGLLYGLGYLVFSVSVELRYHLWTITSVAIAAAFAAGDIRAGARIGRARALAAFAPAIVVGLLCTAWRLA